MTESWDIKDLVRTLSFDTTVVNINQLSGTYVLLEYLIEKNLLYLPCYHHIFEIFFQSIFENFFRISIKYPR